MLGPEATTMTRMDATPEQDDDITTTNRRAMSAFDAAWLAKDIEALMELIH